MEIIKKYFSNFSEVQLKQLGTLKPLYEGFNAAINVISRKDIDNFYERHVLHSLAIAATFEFKTGMQVMDLGCGGGFPGIPLAIFFPEVHFHLVDSIQKKIMVADAVCKAIGLKNITIHHGRSEGIRDKKFDVVVSRAVAPLKDLWFWSKVLIRKNKVQDVQGVQNIPNGLICLKGGDLTKEVFESGCKPMIWEIENIFSEEFFKEKYILYINK